jgi:Na+/phosphate symporter
MKQTAHRTAIANLWSNIFGVALFLPCLRQFSDALIQYSGDPALAVAWAHLILNVVMTPFILVGLRLFGAWIPE